MGTGISLPLPGAVKSSPHGQEAKKKGKRKRATDARGNLARTHPENRGVNKHVTFPSGTFSAGLCANKDKPGIFIVFLFNSGLFQRSVSRNGALCRLSPGAAFFGLPYLQLTVGHRYTYLPTY
jgi:hypothetical protein